MNSLRKHYSDALGLHTWKQRLSTAPQCTACDAPETMLQANPAIKLMLIGDAVKSFSTTANHLLNAMIKSMGLNRKHIYIINMHHDSQPNEINLCAPCIEKQIALLKPRALLVAGEITAHHLLKSTTPIESLRSHIHSHGSNQTPLITTYHPNDLINTPLNKKNTWLDLQLVHAQLL